MSEPTLRDVVRVLRNPQDLLCDAIEPLEVEAGLAVIARTLQDLAERDGDAEYAGALQDALGHVNRARARSLARPMYPAGCGATRDSDFGTISNACEMDTRGTDLCAALNRIRANDEDRANELRIGLNSFEEIANEIQPFVTGHHAVVIKLLVRSLRATFGLGDEPGPTVASPAVPPS